MIKCVGSDIGGTLADYGGEISQFTMDVIKRLPVPFCFVTGFNRYVSFSYMEKLKWDNYYLIAQNGSFAYQGRDLLFSNLLPPEYVSEIVDFGISNNCVARIFCDDNNVYCLFPEGYDKPLERWDSPIYRKYDGKINDLPANVIQVGFFEGLDTILPLEEDAFKKYGDFCIKGPMLYGTHQWLEFNNPMAQKHFAFKKLTERLGFEMKDTMYCGDNYNDLKLLEIAGQAVVVDDAPEDIKQVADVVVGGVSKNGVAEYLKNTFLK